MEFSIPILVKLMSNQVQVDKPWQGPISWEPISSLLTFVMTVVNAIKDAEDNCAVIDQASQNAPLFKDFPLESMIAGLTDQRDIICVHRRQVDQWRNGPLTIKQHFDLAYFEGQCVRLETLLVRALETLRALSEKVKRSRGPRALAD